MHIYCINNIQKFDGEEKELSITIGQYYKITDTDNIGFRIIDNNGNNYWYCKEYFEPINITRDNKIKNIIKKCQNLTQP